MPVVTFLVFLLWLGVYLVTLRPIMNQWLAEHGVEGYPLMLHLFPILAVPILAAFLLSQLPLFNRAPNTVDRADK